MHYNILIYFRAFPTVKLAVQRFKIHDMYYYLLIGVCRYNGQQKAQTT